MTTIHDPRHPSYLDEADVRDELARVQQICHGCRQCVSLCGAFPTLFDLIERVGGDAGALTPADQDQVVDECFQCTLCALDCPYTPDLHEWAVDVPRTMLRATAMQREHGHRPFRHRVADRVMARVGSSAVAPIGRRVAAAAPGSAVRRLVAKVTGVSAERVLPPVAKERFSTWFARRRGTGTEAVGQRPSVTVFATCTVEHHAPAIGRALVEVYERNHIGCGLSAARCCGAPTLHAGDLRSFAEIAAANIARLADDVRTGTHIVVPQPTCALVITREYPEHVDSDDARLVAAHTFDASEYLMRMHAADPSALDTGFEGEVPTRVVHHEPCHTRAVGVGAAGRDLMALTGAEVVSVRQCSGIGGAWGYRVGNETTSVTMAAELGRTIEAAAADAIAGDCHLANTAVTEQTGRTPLHPLQVLARAYGLDP